MERLRDKIRADAMVYARLEKKPLSMGFVIRYLLFSHGMLFVLLTRLCEGLVRIPLVGRPVRRVLWWLTCNLFGSELALGATIGGGLYVPHPRGIVIGACTIGRNVTILQNVTIGIRSQTERVIGLIEDDVFIGAGAAIIGAVIVGKGATIGANAVVVRDVPAGGVLVGNPGRLLAAKEPVA